jgi:carbamoylphosphate synthase large subunit
MHLTAALDDAQGRRDLRVMAVSLGVKVVLPMTERSCILLNEDRDEWLESGIALGCAEAEILRMAFDKALSVESARMAGMRVPATVVPATLEEGVDGGMSLGLPCVVKPRFSNYWTGSQFLPVLGPVYAGSAEGLRRALLAGRQNEFWPLIQKYVPGTGKGVVGVFDRGRPLAIVCHERLRDANPTGSGSSLRRTIPPDPRLVEPSLRALEAGRWHGPAMVEFRDAGEATEPFFIEINGRFWGSLSLSIAAGVDMPTLWVSRLLGRGVGIAPEYRTDVAVRWLMGDLKRIARVLRGRPPDYPGPYPGIGETFKEVFGPQPAGTCPEVWDSTDPLPGVGQWLSIVPWF